MPVIDYVILDDEVIVTAFGGDEVMLYVNGEIVDNPCCIERGDEDIVIVATATAQNEGELISEIATMEITIPAKEPEPNPHLYGYWVVFIDKNGDEIWYQLMLNPQDDYVMAISLRESVYGVGDVRFFFYIDGVRYGPAIDGTPVVYGDANQNPLMANDNYWVTPSGYSYAVGVATDSVSGNKYVMCSKGPYVLGAE